MSQQDPSAAGTFTIHEELGLTDPELGTYAFAVPEHWDATGRRLLIWSEGAFDLNLAPNILGDPPPPPETLESLSLFQRLRSFLAAGSWRPRHLASPYPADDLPREAGHLWTTDLTALCPATPSPAHARLAERLLAEGYALAAAYGSDAEIRTVAAFGLRPAVMTRALARFARSVGTPAHTIAIGRSLGAVAAASLLKHGAVDGAISLGQHALLYTHEQSFDPLLLGSSLLHHELFPWPANWGTPLAAADPLPPLFSEVLPVLLAQRQDPANFARWEVLRRFCGLTHDACYRSTSSFLYYIFLGPGFLDGFRRWLGGDPFSLVGIDFQRALSAADREYIRGLDPTLDIDGVLARMNTQYAGHRGDPDAIARKREMLGISPEQLRGPFITNNAVEGDSDHPTYTVLEAEQVRAAGMERNYLRTFHRFPHGHISLTADQTLDLVHAMDRWLQTGAKPALADPELFPAAHAWDNLHDPGPGPWWRR